MRHIPHIRKATIADIDLLRTIGSSTFIETYAHQNTPENLKLYLEEKFTHIQILTEIQTPQTIFLLVELENEVIGYAKMRINLRENPDVMSLEIERIYIGKMYHGQKYGAELMQKCISIAIENNFKSLWLGVWEHNPKAIEFYQKFGFEIFGTHIFHLGDDAQTDYLMKKTFTQLV
jgi:ribosomal protein S18 acetylase RimI-like enzyme